MIFEEKTLSTREVFDGRLIRVREDVVTVPTGTSTREIVEHCPGAGILALRPDGTFPMVRQFRKVCEAGVLELPAGKVDPGETPARAAERELREETGLTARHVRFLTKTYPSVGFSTEIVYFYLMTGLSEGRRDPDPNEVIEVTDVRIDEAVRRILDGTWMDAKAQIAVLMTWELIRRGELDGYLEQDARAWMKDEGERT